MSTTTSSARPARSSLQRVAVPLVTILAAVAGLAGGRLIDQPGNEAFIAALVLAVVLASAVAWIAARPSPDVLWSGGHDALRAELDRARRHRRTFAMARLELTDPTVEGDAPEAGAEGIALSTFRLIGAMLRITDHAWLDDGDAVVLLPESDRSTAEAFAERIRDAAPGRFTERMGIAVFPDDGLTSGALLDALERGLRGSAIPSPMVRTRVAGIEADLATVAAPGNVAEHVESGIG